MVLMHINTVLAYKNLAYNKNKIIIYMHDNFCALMNISFKCTFFCKLIILFLEKKTNCSGKKNSKRRRKKSPSEDEMRG